jgi:hypothetical protein
MERIFRGAKARGLEVFISPHYFYPTDKAWKFNGPLETDEATSGMFARRGMLNVEGFAGSGADLAGAFQAVHRGRQDYCGRAASRLGTRDQRPCASAPQTQDQ